MSYVLLMMFLSKTQESYKDICQDQKQRIRLTLKVVSKTKDNENL